MTQPELDPEQIAEWEKFADAVDAEERAAKRRARDRHHFAQGLATGIAGSVVVMVLVWSLWS